MRASRAMVVVVGIGLVGCVPSPDRCVDQSRSAGERLECTVPGWTDRGTYLHLPDDWDGVTPAPAIVLLHGAGGSRQGADLVTCPDGDDASPACLAALATAAGYLVIVPDGTGQRPVRRLRSWNAGGGDAGLACLSPIPCRLDVDDLAYLDDVLAEVELAAPIDPARLYAAGLSNGAAMSHRLACEWPGRLAAIATVGGQNQHADAGGACAGDTPVLDVHGVDDPIWPYAGGVSEVVPDQGVYTSAATTMEGWRQRNGCAETFVEVELPDVDPDDGTRVVQRTWDGCDATTVHLAVDGGGHTWPGGHQYFGVDTIGRVTRDLGSEALLAFFEAHARP
ncbi:MAG: PHB depolymerase family esterase [Kofleriaceae bacterium]